MFKSKITFLIATLAITLIGCFQVEEATFIEGEITKINNESGEMEIKVESWFNKLLVMQNHLARHIS